MQINPADWAYGLVGGVMIGGAAAIMLLINGRIAGISGLFGALISRSRPADALERAAFIAGLIGAPAVWALLAGPPSINAPAAPALLVVAGLMVGFGTRMGAGCTSGHGVCGLSRFSPRSLVAVATFMAVGVATVTVVRHVIGAY